MVDREGLGNEPRRCHRIVVVYTCETRLLLDSFSGLCIYLLLTSMINYYYPCFNQCCTMLCLCSVSVSVTSPLYYQQIYYSSLSAAVKLVPFSF